VTERNRQLSKFLDAGGLKIVKYYGFNSRLMRDTSAKPDCGCPILNFHGLRGRYDEGHPAAAAEAIGGWIPIGTEPNTDRVCVDGQMVGSGLSYRVVATHLKSRSIKSRAWHRSDFRNGSSQDKSESARRFPTLP